MHVITLLNQKGGVGKTTLSTHLAQALAMSGFRTLLVDADSQGSATFAVGHNYEPGMYDLLVRDAEWQDVMRLISSELYEHPQYQKPESGVLFLLPSNLETRVIASMIDDTEAVRSRLEQLEDSFDYVVVDTSPTPSLLHGSIYAATDFIIYPTKCESLSMQGLAKSMESLQAANRRLAQYGAQQVEVLGIVPTIFRSKTLEHTENLQELTEVYGDLVWEPIRLSTMWTESSRLARPVWNFAPTSSATHQALAFVSRALKMVQAHVK